MKALKVIGIGILSIIVLFLIVAIFLPSKFHVERSIEVEAKVSKVYNTALNYDLRPKWDPWLEKEPTAEVKIEKSGDGPGSWYTWKGKIIGSGKMMIKEVEQNKRILSKIEFFEPQPAKSDVIWTFSEKDGKTKLTWAFEGEANYPLGRYFGLMMDSYIGKDFEKGLANFDVLLKKIPDFMSRSSEIKETMFESCMALTIESDATMQNMPKIMEENYGKILAVVGNNYELIGYPRCIYNEWNESTGDMKIECAIPVVKEFKGKDNVVYKKLNGGKALVLTHYGPYEALPQSYQKIMDYMKENTIESKGAPWEEYLTDPAVETDQSKWETRIYFPI